VATGSLRLISSAGLRSRLVEYYGEKALVARRAETRASGYATLVRGFLPVEFDPEGSAASIHAFGVHETGRLVRERRSVDAMNRHRNYLGLVRPLLDELLARVEVLQAEVENELRERA
jgi:hypothetical protein